LAEIMEFSLGPTAYSEITTIISTHV